MRRTLTSVGVLLGAALLVGAASAQRFVATKDPENPRVRYPDSSTSVNDRCIITGWKLSYRMTPTYVNGLPVGYCCRHCPSVFAKDPEKALKERGLVFHDPIEPARTAPLDPALRAWANWDLYTFADRRTLAQFKRDPLRVATTLTDPVTQRRFNPTAASPSTTWIARTWWFSSNATKARFVAHPDSFLVQRDFHRD